MGRGVQEHDLEEGVDVKSPDEEEAREKPPDLDTASSELDIAYLLVPRIQSCLG